MPKKSKPKIQQSGLTHSGGIDQLIINSPYNEPSAHWKYNHQDGSFELIEGRRPAGYLIATPHSLAFDDPGVFQEIPLVNRIRPLVNTWRRADYPGTTGITKRLLEHWNEREGRDDRRLFFCQLEAIETLIWLVEGPEDQKVGINIPSDGGDFARLCCKMATGTGKTVVIAMVIAWQILNKVAHRNDRRYSSNILVVAPGLTVRNRLSVVDPNQGQNYYHEFDLVPPNLWDKLRQGRVRIRNWHALQWETEEKLNKKKGVDKRGAKSDEAWIRDVLGNEMSRSRNLLVINDEAHHAWRIPRENAKQFYTNKAERDEATKWVEALDRLHRTRGILRCYDFTATPFVPRGKKASEELLFDWIVSDFGLNDAIESGLVKTPRVVVRDDSGVDPETFKSRLYHLYNNEEVKTDLNQKADENVPLPDLVNTGYHLLGFDWQQTWKEWEKAEHPTPPVMITVANRTETAARVKYSFDKGRVSVKELNDPDLTLHIDSKVLKKAENVEVPLADLLEEKEKLTQNDKAELLRQQVDTIGQKSKPGEQIRHVISVAMLSEGWDAKTVTHIMGLRAFTSQLLCEQVVGRGLRRTSYEVGEHGFFEPEYVNIFGVPFTFLPHEDSGAVPKPPKPKTPIEPDPAKKRFEIQFPNIIRVERTYQPHLEVNWDEVQTLDLSSDQPTLAELARTLEGKTDQPDHDIDLVSKWGDRRIQQTAFEAAARLDDLIRPDWTGNRPMLYAQLANLSLQFLQSGKIRIPGLTDQDETRRRVIINLHMTKIVQHFWHAINHHNTESLEPVFDPERPIGSTGDMRLWYTGKPTGPAARCHINFCVYDSDMEKITALELDRNPEVEAWVKNDHLGFEVFYMHRGTVRKYLPDFLIRFRSGNTLVLEVKGNPQEIDESKWEYMDYWVQAVNTHGGFGHWSWGVLTPDDDLVEILSRHH